MKANGEFRTADGKTVRIPQEELGRFKADLNGELLMPDDSGFEAARRVWNGLIDRRPALVARCASAEDVVRAVGFAHEHKLLFSIRGGGHNVAGSAVVDHGMTIDLSRMKRVAVDQERLVVRAEAGATLGDMDRATQVCGLAVPVGLVSATGIAGLSLHGGLGWLTRQYGLTADNVVSADVVTAEGRMVRADPSNNPDLLWALRGGGGNSGVVTSFEFRAYPVGPRVWFALPMYPAQRSSEVLRFFREFMATAPEQLGAVAVYWNAPEVPEVPKEHQGAPVIMLVACYSGPFDRGEAAIGPLRRVGKPLADLSAPMDFVEVQQFLDADYPEGGMYYWKSTYLEELGDEAIGTLSSYAAVRPSPHSTVDVWALGGALSREGSNGGPLVARQAPYLLGIEANWQDPADNETNIAWTRELHRDMQRFSSGATYLNFPGFGEEGEEMLRRAYGDNYRRLREVKGKYDPDNMFRGQLPIEPAAAPGQG